MAQNQCFAVFVPHWSPLVQRQVFCPGDNPQVLLQGRYDDCPPAAAERTVAATGGGEAVFQRDLNFQRATVAGSAHGTPFV